MMSFKEFHLQEELRRVRPLIILEPPVSNSYIADVASLLSNIYSLLETALLAVGPQPFLCFLPQVPDTRVRWFGTYHWQLRLTQKVRTHKPLFPISRTFKCSHCYSTVYTRSLTHTLYASYTVIYLQSLRVSTGQEKWDKDHPQ